MLVTGSSEACLHRGGELWHAAAGQRRLWVGPGAVGPAERIEASQAGQWLGRELDLLVWNAEGGLNPDALAALAGTLSAGGLWVLLAPPLDQWGSWNDPDYARAGLEAGPHDFLERLARLWAQSPAVTLMAAEAPWPDVPTADASGTPWSPPQPGKPTPAQAEVIAAVEKVVTGHRRRPLVISADRGRGKSAALGMAAACLLSQGRSPILVTAPHRTAVNTLFEHAESAGQGAGPDFRFVPPDVLLREAPEAALVIVDEAAAIPPALLQQLLARYARLVFATTVHGYEGTGRGFVLRFARTLDQQTPQWRHLELSPPIRWAEGDPLEAMMNRAFLLDAAAPEASTEAVPQIQYWPRAERAGNEQCLRGAYGLLVEAHYRTTPADLRPLLDDPRLLVWLALAGGSVVGVITVLEEGGLAPALSRAVFLGERRLRGHLLPQSLANHGGDPEAPTLRYGRIVRVAVHPAWRRRGLARQLVDTAARAGQAQGWDLLGTSFSLEPGVLQLWRHCGLHFLRLGLQRQTSTGAHSAMFGLGLTDAGRATVSWHQQRFARHWPLLLGDAFRALSPVLVWSLCQSLPPPAEPPTGDDWREAGAFARGHRQLALSLWPLRQITLAWLAQGRGDDWDTSEQCLWSRVILQQWDWPALQQARLVRGRGEGEQRLRALAGRLLSESGQAG